MELMIVLGGYFDGCFFVIYLFVFFGYGYEVVDLYMYVGENVG